jgi:hypothetical protein
MRLSRLQVAILGHIGRFKGWVALDQGHLARWFGVKRPSLNAAVKGVVSLGYVEQLTQAQTGDPFCLYRIVIEESDATAANAVACQSQPDTPQGKEVSAPGEHTCQRQPDTGVSASLTPTEAVVYSSRADLDLTRSTRSLSPQPPKRAKRARGASGRDSTEVEHLLAPLRAEPNWAHAVDLLIEPIVRQRKILAPDPADLLRRTTGWAADLPIATLRAAAYRLLEERHSAVTEESIVAAVRGVQRDAGLQQTRDRPAAPAVEADGLLMITERDQPEAFAAWLAHYEAQDGTASLEDGRRLRHVVTLASKHRALRVPSPAPPAPPTHAPDTTVH